MIKIKYENVLRKRVHKKGGKIHEKTKSTYVITWTCTCISSV